MSARERFEAWVVRTGGHPSVLRRNTGCDYALASLRAEYAAWQAARAEALEEVAEAWAVANAQLGCPVETGLEDGCASCNFALLMKDAIKALKD